MNHLPVFPVLIPLVMGALSLCFWRQRLLHQVLGVLGAIAHLCAGVMLLQRVRLHGLMIVEIGNWPAPFGITLVADLFSALMVVMAGLTGVVVVIYSLADVGSERTFFGYYAFLQLLLAGVSGCFLTGDLFNLYVWFEVMLMASYILLALGGEGGQLEGALKYVTMNLVASAFFLSALGILYGLLGTLNMADLSLQISRLDRPGITSTLAMLFLAVFGIKAALFPFFFWLPASYHTPPPAVSALFAGLLTKVGVYSLIRIFTLLFINDIGFTHGLLLALSGLTMVTGVLGALAQQEMRRLLSFDIISQVGYMTLGLALYTPLALAGSILHMVHNILVKPNLFLVSGIILHLRGTTTFDRLGGLCRETPLLASLFLCSALALAGLPPLSGFWSKLLLVQAGLETGNYLLVTVALCVSLLTFLAMAKIWLTTFWGEPPDEPGRADNPEPRHHRFILYLPTAVLAMLPVVVGLSAGPIVGLVLATAEQLMDPAVYVQAVLGRR